MQTYYWLPLLLLALFSPITSPAQTYLATRDTRQILIGDRLFTMQDNVDYRVVGVAPRGGGPYIQTPIGIADCGYTSRFRVLPGGVYANEPTVILKDAEATTGVNPGSPSREGGDGPGTYGRAPFLETTFKGDLISPVELTHVYAAYQWYVDGQPVGTNVKFVGTVKANEPVHLWFGIELAVSQKSGNYSLHIYSGYNELKQKEVKMGATW